MGCGGARDEVIHATGDGGGRARLGDGQHGCLQAFCFPYQEAFERASQKTPCSWTGLAAATIGNLVAGIVQTDSTFGV